MTTDNPIKVRAIIPYMHHPSREAGLQWVTEWYKSRVDDVLIARSVEEPFNKSKTVNEAARDSQEFDILIIGDADCVICNYSLRVGISVAYNGQKLVIPHNSSCYTDPDQAQYLLRQPPALGANGRWFSGKRSKKPSPGGIWILPAQLLLARPMDERFQGWGGEDNEFIRRVRHTRLAGPLFHIYHEIASRAHRGRNLNLLRPRRRVRPKRKRVRRRR